MTIQTINPTASNHDAREAAGTVTVTGNLFVTAGTHWMGLLLPGVALTATTPLTAATLYYKCVDAVRQNPNLDWYAQAADNAGVFTTATNDISGRARGTAVVRDVATSIGTTTYRTLDITALVDEVRLRPGWVSGNNMALIGDCLAPGLEIGSYDTGANTWYVEINYTLPTSGDRGAIWQMPGLLAVSAGGAGLQQVRI